MKTEDLGKLLNDNPELKVLLGVPKNFSGICWGKAKPVSFIGRKIVATDGEKKNLFLGAAGDEEMAAGDIIPISQTKQLKIVLLANPGLRVVIGTSQSVGGMGFKTIEPVVFAVRQTLIGGDGTKNLFLGTEEDDPTTEGDAILAYADVDSVADPVLKQKLKR